jgi:hypothetical protein
MNSIPHFTLFQLVLLVLLGLYLSCSNLFFSSFFFFFIFFLGLLRLYLSCSNLFFIIFIFLHNLLVVDVVVVAADIIIKKKTLIVFVVLDSFCKQLYFFNRFRTLDLNFKIMDKI